MQPEGAGAELRLERASLQAKHLAEQSHLVQLFHRGIQQKQVA